MHKQQKYSHPNRCEGRLSIFMMPDVMFTTMMVKDSPSENVSQTPSPPIEGFFVSCSGHGVFSQQKKSIQER